jgi:adenylate kinase
MLKFKVIFISGVHGVGKGYLCSRINEVHRLPVFSASALIKDEKKSEIDVDKRVIDAGNNQDYLISALNNLNPPSKSIILDGHFCLYGEAGIVDIGIKTFESMRLKSIITLYDVPEKIYKRMHERDGKSLDIDVIHSLQERELELAQLTADQLNVRLHIISADESCGNLQWFESLF